MKNTLKLFLKKYQPKNIKVKKYEKKSNPNPKPIVATKLIILKFETLLCNIGTNMNKILDAKIIKNT